MAQQSELSRLERCCAGAKSLTEAAESVRQLHRAIWEECAAKTEYPGGPYGDALVEAGFQPEDRAEMAAFPFSTSTRIAQRFWKRSA